MECYKIVKLLNNSTASTFVTKKQKKQKWIEGNDLSCGKYSFNKSTEFKTSMLRSNLCDYSDTYIAMHILL